MTVQRARRIIERDHSGGFDGDLDQHPRHDAAAPQVRRRDQRRDPASVPGRRHVGAHLGSVQRAFPPRLPQPALHRRGADAVRVPVRSPRDHGQDARQGRPPASEPGRARQRRRGRQAHGLVRSPHALPERQPDVAHRLLLQAGARSGLHALRSHGAARGWRDRVRLLSRGLGHAASRDAAPARGQGRHPLVCVLARPHRPDTARQGDRGLVPARASGPRPRQSRQWPEDRLHRLARVAHRRHARGRRARDPEGAARDRHAAGECLPASLASA